MSPHNGHREISATGPWDGSFCSKEQRWVRTQSSFRCHYTFFFFPGSCYKVNTPKLRIVSSPQMLFFSLRKPRLLLTDLWVGPNDAIPVDLLTLLCTKLFPVLQVQMTSYLPSMPNDTPQGWGVQQREYISIVMSPLAFRPAVLRQGFLVFVF